MLERVELGAAMLESASLAIEPSPLDCLGTTDDIEADCAAELEIVESEFSKRASNEKKRFEKATDSEYWACICFQDRKQVEEFVRACGMDPREKYVDGQKMAKNLGIKLTPSLEPFGKAKIDPKLARLAMEK